MPWVFSRLIGPGIAFLPISLLILMSFTVIITYLSAVINGDVVVLFPYISDTGTTGPESCVFSQLLNMASFIALLTMYARYKLIMELTERSNNYINKLAKIALGLAVLSVFGLSLVANFQETKIEPVHLTGAFMIFGLGCVYALFDTIISYMMFPAYNGLYICRIRMVITIFGFISLLITVISGAISRKKWDSGMIHINDDRLHWKPDDPGYTAHIISTFGEWVVASAFLSYFFTYIRDFQKFKVKFECCVFVTHLDLPFENNTHTVIPDESSGLIT